jgi:glycosyltransferase involved in cell wall biosynthesis
MKISIIGRTYMIDLSRRQIYYLSKYDDIDLKLTTLKSWKHSLRNFKFNNSEKDIKQIHVLKPILNGHGMAFLYKSLFLNLITDTPDIIHINQEPCSLSAFQIILLKKIYNLKSKIILFTWENINRTYPFPFNFIYKFNINNVHGILCGNAEAEKVVREKGFSGITQITPEIGIEEKVYKKVESDKLKKQLSIKKNTVIIGYIGRIIKAKGLVCLFKALSEIKGEDWKLVLVGKGKDKQLLIKLAENLEIINHIYFIGAISHENVPNYLSLMDMLVLPSLTTDKWKEQLGHVIIEAMACEVPVIGSDSGAIPEVISKAGLIARENDHLDWAKKIKLLVKSPSRRRALAKKGKKRILTTYTNKIIAEKIREFYYKVMS